MARDIRDVPKREAKRFAVAAQTKFNDAETLATNGGSVNSVVTLFINASITASDAICISVRAQHWRGGDHAGAIRFLATVDQSASANLQKVLANKTKWEYDIDPPTVAQLKIIRRAAEALVARAQQI